MGEYLSKPNQEKKSDEGETGKVCSNQIFIFKYFTRLDMASQECKDGEEVWKIPIFVH